MRLVASVSPRTLRADRSLSSIGDAGAPRVRRYTPVVCLGDLILIFSCKNSDKNYYWSAINEHIFHRSHTIQIQRRANNGRILELSYFVTLSSLRALIVV